MDQDDPTQGKHSEAMKTSQTVFSWRVSVNNFPTIDHWTEGQQTSEPNICKFI